MARVLIAENDIRWGEILKHDLERIVGKGNVDVVLSSDDVNSKIKETGYDGYGAFIIDAQLPQYTGGQVRGYGINLAKKFYDGRIDKRRIVVIGDSLSVLEDIKAAGITIIGRKDSTVNGAIGKSYDELLIYLENLLKQRFWCGL